MFGIMRGFQKGITLCIGTSGSAFEVAGGWHKRKYGGWVVCSIIVSLQSSLELELGVRSLDFEFGVGLDFDWTFA